MKRSTTTRLEDDLRRAIRDAGCSRYRISRLTDVSQAVLSQFVHKRRTLTLRTAGKIADLLGWSLTRDSARKTP